MKFASEDGFVFPPAIVFTCPLAGLPFSVFSDTVKSLLFDGWLLTVSLEASFPDAAFGFIGILFGTFNLDNNLCLCCCYSARSFSFCIYLRK